MSWYQSDLLYTPPEPYVPCSWSTGTDAEIAEALEMHYAGRCNLAKYWAIGDTRNVNLSAMSALSPLTDTHVAQTVTFVLTEVGGKYLADGKTKCAFQVDQLHSLKRGGIMNSTGTNSGGWKNSARRTWCNTTYRNAIPSSFRSLFKQFINQSGLGGGSESGVEDTIDYFALRAGVEVFGVHASGTVEGEGSWVEWYATPSNRIKQINGTNDDWWLRSPSIRLNDRFGITYSSGSYITSSVATADEGIAPFGVI